jgi:oxygen-independent coproporphyrinogen-3 oxidase
VREKVDGDIWLDAYLKELDKSFLAQNDSSAYQVTSIFFGGGTPSLMPAKTVEGIIHHISKTYKIADDIEITLEANPTSVEYEKFKSFRAAGVNRVSIGIQSFEAAELKFLGREHSANEARTAIEYAANIFPRYSFDLIYALPQQKLKDWETKLSEAIKLTRGHISLYQLTIEQNTSFYNQYQLGKFEMPENDLAAEFYELTQNICEANNLPAYEISNHASAGNESKHNLTYWRYGDYLGVGPGAHGRTNGFATTQTRSPEKWLEKPMESEIKLTEEEKFQEMVMMGMRLKEGISAQHLSKLHNIEALRAEGYITVTPQKIQATAKGLLMLNSVVQKLFDY